MQPWVAGNLDALNAYADQNGLRQNELFWGRGSSHFGNGRSRKSRADAARGDCGLGAGQAGGGKTRVGKFFIRELQKLRKCMPQTGISPRAYLIIDNSVLSMLSAYYCAKPAIRVPARQRIASLKQWLGEQISMMGQFTPDGFVHCTDCVIDEYKPAGILAGLPQQTHYDEYFALRKHIASCVSPAVSSAGHVNALHNLPGLPKKRCPGHNDLSLVVLGLQLAANGEPVYVISNDQDLLYFISWIRTKPEARKLWGNPLLLQGLLGLTYLDLIHRDCKIQTEIMKDILHFALADHYERTSLVGTPKGNSIMQQLLEVHSSFTDSVKIKALVEGVA